MYILYIHPSLCGTPNWWKVGQAITPYSAVRVRQRFMVAPFEIPNIWFGRSADIETLENAVTKKFPGTEKGGGNTEMVNCTLSELTSFINDYITEKNGNNQFLSDQAALDIIELPLDAPYTATNSSNCPFGFPSEKNIHEWAAQECDNFFGTKANPSMIYTHIAKQKALTAQSAAQANRFLDFFTG